MEESNPFAPPVYQELAPLPTPVMAAAVAFGLAGALSSAPLCYLVASGAFDVCSSRIGVDWAAFFLLWGYCTVLATLSGAFVWWRRTRSVWELSGASAGALVTVLTICGFMAGIAFTTLFSAPSAALGVFVIGSVVALVVVAPFGIPFGVATGWMLDRYVARRSFSE